MGIVLGRVALYCIGLVQFHLRFLFQGLIDEPVSLMSQSCKVYFLNRFYLRESRMMIIMANVSRVCQKKKEKKEFIDGRVFYIEDEEKETDPKRNRKGRMRK